MIRRCSSLNKARAALADIYARDDLDCDLVDLVEAEVRMAFNRVRACHVPMFGRARNADIAIVRTCALSV